MQQGELYGSQQPKKTIGTRCTGTSYITSAPCRLGALLRPAEFPPPSAAPCSPFSSPFLIICLSINPCTAATCSTALWSLPLQAGRCAAFRFPPCAAAHLHQPHAAPRKCARPHHGPTETKRPRLLRHPRGQVAAQATTSASWHPRQLACWLPSLGLPRLWTSWPSGGSLLCLLTEHSGLPSSTAAGRLHASLRSPWNVPACTVAVRPVDDSAASSFKHPRIPSRLPRPCCCCCCCC